MLLAVISPACSSIPTYEIVCGTAKVSNETVSIIKIGTDIPFITRQTDPDFYFGCTINASKNGFTMYSIISMPKPKILTSNRKLTKNIESNRLIFKSAVESFEDTASVVLRLDEGDLKGAYTIEIYINDTVTKKVVFNVVRGASNDENSQYDQAIRDFTKVIEINPRDFKAYSDRGDAYREKGQYDKAIHDYTKAIKINPKHARSYNSRGGLYANKSQNDRAIRDYTKAIEINPKYAMAYMNRGLALYDKGQVDQAIHDYSKSLDINPRFAEAYYSRGLAFGDKGQIDQAINNYTKAIENNPKDANGYNNRGGAYVKKGQYDQAIYDYTKAIKIAPRLAAAYSSRGFVYHEKIGNKVKGCADWKKACKLGECGNYNAAKQKNYCL